MARCKQQSRKTTAAAAQRPNSKKDCSMPITHLVARVPGLLFLPVSFPIIALSIQPMFYLPACAFACKSGFTMMAPFLSSAPLFTSPGYIFKGSIDILLFQRHVRPLGHIMAIYNPTRSLNKLLHCDQPASYELSPGTNKMRPSPGITWGHRFGLHG